MIYSLIVGAIVGWLAAKIMNTKSSILTNIIVGIVGGFIGHLLFGVIGLAASGVIGDILISTVGACVLIWLMNKFSK